MQLRGVVSQRDVPIFAGGGGTGDVLSTGSDVATDARGAGDTASVPDEKVMELPLPLKANDKAANNGVLPATKAGTATTDAEEVPLCVLVTMAACNSVFRDEQGVHGDPLEVVTLQVCVCVFMHISISLSFSLCLLQSS
jgi:hypothetical protein